MRSRDLCYSTDFEERIAKALEAAGNKVYRSVYADLGSQKSQIDLVVFNPGMPVCIECKAYDAVRYMYKRSTPWGYLGIDGKFREIPNPIKQVQRQARNMSTSMRIFEDKLPDRLTVPHALYAVVLKGDLPDYKSEHVYTERSLDMLIEYCKDVSFPLDGRVAEPMAKWLERNSDTSPERLKEHAKYIRQCKKNGTGPFAPEVLG